MTITTILAHALRRITARRNTSRSVAVFCLSVCTFLAAPRCQAQDVPDAAEAARQDRAKKSTPPNKSKHVYTDEDLRRSQILTPEDQARMEARKNKENPEPTDPKRQDALDATSKPAEVPLGDIARRLREQKQARESRSTGTFHLPANEPALAAPVIPSQPKISPARPAAALHPPAMNSGPLRRVDPFARRWNPNAPPLPPRRPAVIGPPRAPAGDAQPELSSPDLSSSAVQPKAPLEKRRSAAMPSDSEQLRTVVVQPGDSLWKLAEENLGAGSRWQEFLAVNPEIADGSRIAAGTRIFLPNSAPRLLSDAKIIVQTGDTLSQIAQKHYRNAKAWECIAQANPQIADANRIFEGQELLLPAACR